MDKFLPESLERFYRRHPWLMLATVLALAVLVTPILLFMGQAPTVLYQTF